MFANLFTSDAHCAFRDSLPEPGMPHAESEESAPCPPDEEPTASGSENAPPQTTLEPRAQEHAVLKASPSEAYIPLITNPFLIYPIPEPTVMVDPSTGSTLYPSQCVPTPTLIENVATTSAPIPSGEAALSSAAANHTSLRTFTAHAHPWTIDAMPPPGEQPSPPNSLVVKVRIVLLLLGVLIYIIFWLCRALLRRAKRAWRHLRQRSHGEQLEANDEPRVEPVLQPMLNPHVHLNHW